MCSFSKLFFPLKTTGLKVKQTNKKMHFRCLTKGFIRGYRDRDSHITNQFLNQVVFKENNRISSVCFETISPCSSPASQKQGRGPSPPQWLFSFASSNRHLFKDPRAEFSLSVNFFFNKLWALFEVKVGNSSGSRMHFLCLHCLGWFLRKLRDNGNIIQV